MFRKSIVSLTKDNRKPNERESKVLKGTADVLNERERTVLSLLIEDPHTGVNAISGHLDVSAVTVRGILDDLAEKGFLIRTRGGALPAFHPEILLRQRSAGEIKSAIAKTAASLINDGDTVMIEAGTTTALIGRYLLGKSGVKVVTDSTLLLPYARSNPALSLTFVGGVFRAEAESMIGPTATYCLEQFQVKTAFIGTDGFSLENGLTAHMMEATEVVRTMHRRSEETVLLADSSKWGKSGFARIIPLEDVDVLVTDEGFPEGDRGEIEARGVKLLIAGEKGAA